MPFLAPVVSFFVGLAGTTFGGLILSVGLSVASALLNKPKQRQQEGGGRQLDLENATDISNKAIIGRMAVGGSLVFHTSYGDKNDDLYLVIALADHPVDGLETVYVNGKAVTLNQANGYTSEYGLDLQIIFYNGDQAIADPTLTTYGHGHWTSSHIGKGRAYAIVKIKYNDEVWTAGLPTFRWVLRGMRLYDWRYDSTQGGAGTQRIDNPATWAWSENPVVAYVNYRMGLEVNGVRCWGRANGFDSIDIASATAAANACDEQVYLESGGSENRYKVAATIDASQDHDSHEALFRESFMGLTVNTGGYTKILAGVQRTPVMHFSDDDLVAGTDMFWSAKQGRNELINTIRGYFTDPAQNYEPGEQLSRFSQSDIIIDGGELVLDNDFEWITSGTQCQRSMEILRRQARLQGRAECSVGARGLVLEVGDWITYSSDRYGWVNKVFEVSRTQELSDLIGVRITLREIDSSVFDWLPEDELDPGEVASLPDYSPPSFNITGFGVGTFTLTTPGGEKRPGITAIWDPIDDSRVKAIAFEYRKVGDSEAMTQTSHEPASGSFQWVSSVVGQVDYEVRARAVVTTPNDSSQWTVWKAVDNATDQFVVETAAVAQAVPDDSITLDMLSPQVRMQLELEANLIDLFKDPLLLNFEQGQRSAEAAMSNILSQVEEVEGQRELKQDLNELRSEVDTNISAQITTLQQTLTTETDALAQSIQTVETRVDDTNLAVTQNLQSINGIAGEWGVTIDSNGIVTGAVKLSGDQSHSEFGVLADKFLVAHPGGGGDPVPAFGTQLVDGQVVLSLHGKLQAHQIEGDEVSAAFSRVGLLKTGRIESDDGEFFTDYTNKHIKMIS